MREQREPERLDDEQRERGERAGPVGDQAEEPRQREPERREQVAAREDDARRKAEFEKQQLGVSR